MNLRLAVEPGRSAPVRPPHCVVALNGKGTVVDPRNYSFPIKSPVLVVGPQGAPFNQRPVAVPLAGLHPAQSRRRRLPKGQEDMRMVVVRMVAFFRHRRVNCDIGNHAAAYEGFLDEA
jgi:hypothetical protein